jgi:hypothetical protein
MILRMTIKAGNIATESDNMVSLYGVNKEILKDEIVRLFSFKEIEEHYRLCKGPAQIVTAEDFKTT